MVQAVGLRAYRISFHGLCVPKRITFSGAVLMYRVLHGTAPPYL